MADDQSAIQNTRIQRTGSNNYGKDANAIREGLLQQLWWVSSLAIQAC